jgi:hypothetical protein
MSKKLTYTPAQEAYLKTLSKEELKDFNALDEEERLELLEMQIGLQDDVKKLEGKIDLENVGYKADGATIFMLDGDGDKGVRGIKAGSKIKAQFLGFSYIFSDEAIENWTSVKTADGMATKYRSEYARFRRTNGKEFGIFTCPMMRNALRTLLTNSATPNRVAKDPVVEIEYFGKVSKEVAKKDFNFEYTATGKAHAVRVLKEKGAVEDLSAGIHCYLTSPIPAGKLNRDDLTNEEAELMAYERQVESNKVIGNNNSPQVAMQ